MGNDAENRTSPARDTLIQNEQVKVRSAYLNGMAIAILAVGALAPIAASASATTTPSFPPAAFGVVCMIISVGLHWAAATTLEGLRT